MENKSACTTDYRTLEHLLAEGKWFDADVETAKKICEIMGRNKEGWLRVEDIKNFPYKDLAIIDKLWLQYSNGQFGFSVQKRIWLECGGEPGIYNDTAWNNFGEKVGWRVNNYWLHYSEINFSHHANAGHLPRVEKVLVWWCGLGFGWSLLSRSDF